MAERSSVTKSVIEIKICAGNDILNCRIKSIARFERTIDGS